MVGKDIQSESERLKSLDQRPVDQGNVLKAAGAMGAATFMSRILGLVREQVFAFLFGAGNVTDAFNIAFRIPNLLRDLFAEGAMSSALVPTFTRVRAEQGERRAWRVAGLVFRVLFILVGVLAVAGMIFAEPLVGLYASAFREVPGKFELTTRMTQIMFPFFPLVALAAAFMGILNACGKFFLPAFASALFNLFSILTGVTGYFIFKNYDLGMQPIEGMAIGVVVGGAVQAFSQLPTLFRAGYRWVPRESTDPVWHQDPALRRMLWLMIPGMVGLAATQINVLVNSVLATGEGTGAVSWLNYAFRLMQFPIGIFGVSLAAATLPQVSLLWVAKNYDGASATLTHSLKQVFAVNLPASAGLAFLGYPIIQLLFEYGHFSISDTRSTALGLAAYAAGLTAYSAVKVLVPVCYALGNTRLPVISSVMAVALTIVLNLLMVGPLGYLGLALGTSIAATLNGLFLLVAVRSLMAKEGGAFKLLPLFRNCLGHLTIALIMGVVCHFSWRFLDPMIPDLSLSMLGGLGKVLVRGLKIGLLIAEGLVLAVLLARLFKLPETSQIFDIFAKKIKKKLSHK